MSSLNDTTPEKSAWGYKGLIVAFLIASTFIGFFYLAVTSEPDYMPSQQKARQQEALQQKQNAEKQQTASTVSENKSENPSENKSENTATEQTETTPANPTEKTENKPAQAQ